MLKEDAPIKYEKVEEDIKHIHHKLFYILRNKKVKVPSYKNESDTVFLSKMRELHLMAVQHKFIDDPNKIELVYIIFADTVKGDALDTWNEILNDARVHPMGVRDQTAYATYPRTFRDMDLDIDALDNKKEYLQSTRKSQSSTAKEWTKRIKVINAYMSFMDAGARRLTDKEIIHYVIKPSIPKKCGQKSLELDKDQQ